MAFKFEKLEVWNLAIEVADKIDKLTMTFPKHQMFILTSQIKRAADSISLNIAEGSTGQSNAEQNRFLAYAQRLALEVVNCLHLAKRRNYLNDSDFEVHYNSIEHLVIKLQAFRNSINRAEANLASVVRRQ